MSGIPLFEINPALNRAQLAEEFKANRRIQIRDVLTERTAREVQRILAQQTRWQVAWRAGEDGPNLLSREEMRQMNAEKGAMISRKVATAAAGRDYAFVYSSFPILDAYLGKWNEGSAHDLLLEHINSEPLLGLVREVTGMPDLRKGDAQATLYAPNQFLAEHDDSGEAEGRRVAYVLNMTVGDWRPDWGGYLNFFDEEGDIVQGFRPRFNALNMFAVPQRHNVSYVPPFSPVGRFAITGWFRDR
jgi:SM-20-related protein